MFGENVLGNQFRRATEGAAVWVDARTCESGRAQGNGCRAGGDRRVRRTGSHHGGVGDMPARADESVDVPLRILVMDELGE